MKRLRDRNIDLDAVDARILSALAGDARMSVAELARSVRLSAPSAAERIRRLEESGAIEGYAASIDPRALGLKVSAWLRVRPVPGELGTVADILRSMPEIVECDRVTGEDCFVARACEVDRRPRAADRRDHPSRDDHDLDHPVHAGQTPPAANRFE